MSPLQEKYKKEVIPVMKAKFGYKNDLAVPRVEKVIVNAGIGKTLKDSKLLENIIKDITLITGQKPALRRAKKAISSFKIREGMLVGLVVTLRGKRMYEFINRLVNAALPRIRDFRGLSPKSFDGHGNFSIGIKEHLVFPEISTEEVSSIFGLEITIVTTAKRDEEAKELLKLLGFPIR